MATQCLHLFAIPAQVEETLRPDGLVQKKNKNKKRASSPLADAHRSSGRVGTDAAHCELPSPTPMFISGFGFSLKNNIGDQPATSEILRRRVV